MAHSDDATKSWIKAIPIKNSDGVLIFTDLLKV